MPHSMPGAKPPQRCLLTQVYNAHNLYGMSETIATATALQQLRNKRQFILTRCVLLHPGCTLWCSVVMCCRHGCMPHDDDCSRRWHAWGDAFCSIQ